MEHAISLFPLVGARSRYIESYWPVRFLYILYGCDIVDGVEILKMTIFYRKKEAHGGGGVNARGEGNLLSSIQ